MTIPQTDRRSMLKLGALAATPLAVLAPSAVLAASDDGTAARLSLLETRTAIEELARKVVRRFNDGGVQACADLARCADAFRLDPQLSAIRPDPAADMVVELAADSSTATCRLACLAEHSLAFAGDTTIERMARFQGQSAATSTTSATLDLALERSGQGWTVRTMHVA
jgi:hypothetical protein